MRIYTCELSSNTIRTRAASKHLCYLLQTIFYRMSLSKSIYQLAVSEITH